MVMDHREEERRIAELFHARLTYLMEREGLDPEKGEHLARFVGVSKGTGYNWITPGKKPNARTLKKIAEAFGSSADYLLGLSDEPGRCLTERSAETVADRAAEDAKRASRR